MDLSRELSPDRCPGQISWHYDRAEIIADGVVHAIGVCLGLLGAVTIVVISINTERVDVAPILVYVIGLVTMLAFSAAYNMWPVSPAKWVLRRFDHSAIYLLIAGTYTPFLMQMKNVLASASLGRGLVERCYRHGSEARTSGAVRSPCRHSLPAAWLERHHCLRLARHAPKLKPMASRDRGHPLYAWHALSCFAALALSQRDLARFCAGRGKLPLFGGPRLFAVGLILVMPAALRSSSESN